MRRESDAPLCERLAVFLQRHPRAVFFHIESDAAKVSSVRRQSVFGRLAYLAWPHSGSKKLKKRLLVRPRLIALNFAHGILANNTKFSVFKFKLIIFKS